MNMSNRVANRRVLMIDDMASTHQGFRKFSAKIRVVRYPWPPSKTCCSEQLGLNGRPSKSTRLIRGGVRSAKLGEYILLLHPELSTGTLMGRIVIF
jgi:hypothetical protein